MQRNTDRGELEVPVAICWRRIDIWAMTSFSR
jgi:hypothetical protein